MFGGRFKGKEKVKRMQVGHMVDLTFYGEGSPFGPHHCWVAFEKVAPNAWRQRRILDTATGKKTQMKGQAVITDDQIVAMKGGSESFCFLVPHRNAEGDYNMLRRRTLGNVCDDDTTYPLKELLAKAAEGEARLRLENSKDGLLVNISTSEGTYYTRIPDLNITKFRAKYGF